MQRNLKLIISASLFSLLAFWGCVGLAQEDREIFKEGIEAANKGLKDSAFMSFHLLLKSYFTTQYNNDAFFATGEYYFEAGAYYEAEIAFRKLIETYPKNSSSLFALYYLVKIAEQEESPDQAYLSYLKKQIIEFKQLALLFSDFKQIKYLSALRKNYRAVYFIDRVEFYENEELCKQFGF